MVSVTGFIIGKRMGGGKALECIGSISILGQNVMLNAAKHPQADLETLRRWGTRLRVTELSQK